MNTFLSWIKAVLAYFSGKSAGEAAVKTEELQTDDAASRAISKAAVDAPATDDAVAARMRAAKF